MTSNYMEMSEKVIVDLRTVRGPSRFEPLPEIIPGFEGTWDEFCALCNRADRIIERRRNA